MERISVIVPVYNGEAYLSQCADSVLGQDYPELELVLVDDGSTDGSGAICDGYGRRFENVRVIHQRNAGQSAARRAGLEAASGSYLMFADADDWLAPGICGRLYQTAVRERADMVFSRVRRIYEDGSSCQLNGLEAGVYTGLETAAKSLSSRRAEKVRHTLALWSILFQREPIERRLREIDPRIWYGEDAACLLGAELDCGRVAVEDTVGYYYRMHSQSVTHSHGRSNVSSMRLLYRYLRGLYREKQVPEEMFWALDLFVIRNLLLNGRDAFCGFDGIYPYEGTRGEGRAAVYGAGLVGQELFRFLKERHRGPAVWADRRWESLKAQGWPAEPPEALLRGGYDFVLIAALDEGMGKEMKGALSALGIPEEKILLPSQRVIDSAYTRRVLEGFLKGEAHGTGAGGT